MNALSTDRLHAVSRFVGQRRTRGLDLVERLALLHQIRDDVAHENHHVAIVHDLHLLGEAAVSGNDVGADVLVDERRRRNRQVDQPVQRVDLALDAPAVGQIDHGKRVMSMTSPVTTTSDALKSTKLSASLWAAGW